MSFVRSLRKPPVSREMEIEGSVTPTRLFHPRQSLRSSGDEPPDSNPKQAQARQTLYIVFRDGEPDLGIPL